MQKSNNKSDRAFVYVLTTWDAVNPESPPHIFACKSINNALKHVPQALQDIGKWTRPDKKTWVANLNPKYTSINRLMIKVVEIV